MAETPDGMEKTEQATTKRLSEAREKGQVSKSMDVTTSAIILFGGMSIFFFGSAISASIVGFTKTSLMNLGNVELTELATVDLIKKLLMFIASILGPIALTIFAISLASEIFQVGFKFATKKFTEGLRFKQIFNPFSGLKKIFFSSNSLFELAKGIAKIIILGTVAYTVLANKETEIIGLIERPFADTANFLFATSFELIWKMGLVYIFISLADYYYQKWRFSEDMKMTKQEVKDENKQMEGDPLIKSRIRSIMRSQLRKLMIKMYPVPMLSLPTPPTLQLQLSINKNRCRLPKWLQKVLIF